MSFFIQLVEATDADRRAFESLPKVQRMSNQGLSLPEYLDFLHDLYHVVWHFCPIMAAAAGRCGDDFGQVRYALYDDIHEEQGHEKWVLDDIAALGGNVEAVKANLPCVPVQAMIAYNYYAPERIHPCAVLGMLYMLEVVSSVYGGPVSTSIAKAIGRDESRGGFKFLQSHASMDLDHVAKLRELLKTVEDPAAQEAIINTAKVNFHLFGQMLAS
jgi:pyrroloquinoline quinone (PQQ) biosynthesis protein C